MIVRSNTELVDTCCEFIRAAVERKDDERAGYWSRVAFSYCDLPTNESYNKQRARFVTKVEVEPSKAEHFLNQLREKR